MTQTTSWPELPEIGRFLVECGVIVLCVRPPLNPNDGWQAHFRQRDKETAWIYGKPQPTFEEAMMSVFGKLETLLDAKLISHASLGRSALPGKKRFCTLESPDHENYRAQGDTLEEAVEDCLKQVEKRVKKPIPVKDEAPSPQARKIAVERHQERMEAAVKEINAAPVEDDPLAGLLG